MIPLLEEKFKVRNYEVGAGKKLSLHHLLNYFQEIASNHASMLGWSYEDMLEKGFFWALSRMELEFERLPNWGETVRVQTWAKGTEKFFAVRDFLVLDLEGNELVRASSVWLVVDIATKRPKRASIIMDKIPNLTEKNALKISLGKLTPLENKVLEVERAVNQSELDLNRHVNNAKYIDWLIDCFPINYIEEKELQKLTLQFVSETKAGDSVVLELSESENKSLISAHFANSNKKVVEGLFEWKGK
jgi:medium-chain acyl-[acyl-carrier-protein] hydrolase